MQCWKCGKENSVSGGKVSFKAICEFCNAWLHTCRQCQHHALGKPNECNISGTDFISDREKFNLCEEFSPKQTFDEKKAPLSNPKKRFDDLFK